MAKMRIHEFAKELEIAGKDILAILEEMGEGVKTVSSSIDDELQEKVRKKFDADEIAIFRRVYAEGNEMGEFDMENVDIVADITHYCIKGLEVPYIYGRLGHGLTDDTSRPLVAKFVYGALRKGGL